MSNKRYSRAELRMIAFKENGGKKERTAGGVIYTIANKKNKKWLLRFTKVLSVLWALALRKVRKSERVEYI